MKEDKDLSHNHEDSSSHDDCPYCALLSHKKEEGHTDDCPYCQESAIHDESECPYCKDSENSYGNDPAIPDSQDYKSQGLDAPDLPKPDPDKEPKMGVESLEAPKENSEDIKETVHLDHSKDALQAIAKEIENEDGTNSDHSDVAENIDAPDLVNDTNMEGNTSHPVGYSESLPQDMGLEGSPKLDDEDAEIPSDEPDYMSVLHEGLENNSSDIKRERIVQMVSQALSGFKNSKALLERSQTESPELYQSSIMMLKAMIEMAHMLGFGENEMGEPQEDEWSDPFPEHPSHNGNEQEENEWKEPFPEHSSHSAAPMQAPAPAPITAAQPAINLQPKKEGQESDGSIGKPIGKLPTSATTKHVPKAPLLPGSINAKGQKKVIDFQTGKTRFIDMKQGRVQGPTGIPVKPSKA